MAIPVVMQGTYFWSRQQGMSTHPVFTLLFSDALRAALRGCGALPPKRLLALLVCVLLLASPAGAADPGPPQGAQAARLAESAPPAPVQTTEQKPDETANHATWGVPAPRSGVEDDGSPAWRELEPGLLFGEFQMNDGDARLTALRIDPERFEFTLCSRSEDGGQARPLSQWGEQYNLAAAINASMYLPDGSTSTGYMRQGTHVNNGRIVQRFGAFFVAGPDDATLPSASIIDRDDPLWRQNMDHYSLVIQNYRMINADRRILWTPGGPLYSISAVALDGDGQILFLHCRQRVEAYSFAQQVLHLPLNVRTVMYVEGGGQAGLLVRSAALTRELTGLDPGGLLVTGDLRAVLPNVLGARRKATAADAAQITQRPNSATQPGSTDAHQFRLPSGEASEQPEQDHPAAPHYAQQAFHRAFPQLAPACPLSPGKQDSCTSVDQVPQPPSPDSIFFTNDFDINSSKLK